MNQQGFEPRVETEVVYISCSRSVKKLRVKGNLRREGIGDLITMGSESDIESLIKGEAILLAVLVDNFVLIGFEIRKQGGYSSL